LATIASQHQPHAVAVANILDLPHQDHAFDFAISIAVIHHLSTPERRIEAIKSILQTLKPDGKVLIYVWALEQDNSRRGWTANDEQDVMVPWVMRGSKKDTNSGAQVSVEGRGDDRIFHRYYHLYCKDELEQNIVASGAKIVEAGYEKDNWWAIATPV
jgi:tRNA (uracil-5-)-methyltransferase TRM9